MSKTCHIWTVQARRTGRLPTILLATMLGEGQRGAHLRVWSGVARTKSLAFFVADRADATRPASVSKKYGMPTCPPSIP